MAYDTSSIKDLFAPWVSGFRGPFQRWRGSDGLIHQSGLTTGSITHLYQRYTFCRIVVVSGGNREDVDLGDEITDVTCLVCLATGPS